MADTLDGYVNALFSISNTALSESEKTQLAAVQMSWVRLNTRLGRHFIDAIAPVGWLLALEQKLIDMGRDPIRIGVFDKDGQLIGQQNAAEWLKVARNVDTYDASGNLVSSVRPTAWVDVHQWAGWGVKFSPPPTP